MTWVKLDDGFVDNRKMERVGDHAFRVHVAALCYCARNLTDGIVPESRAKLLLNRVTSCTIGELVAAGLWRVHPDGYEINDYLDFNPSREKVLADRAAMAERQKRWRAKVDASRNGVTDASCNAAPTRPAPLRAGEGRVLRTEQEGQTPGQPLRILEGGLCSHDGCVNGWVHRDEDDRGYSTATACPKCSEAS